MRIFPASFMNINKINSSQTKFERKSTALPSLDNFKHQYTGNASVDLAYASIFDSEIARDLKLMGLI